MAGIYIHIPFCKQACIYCNFHFSTLLKNKGELVEALLKELELSQDYLPDKDLDTLYFGGGTPSLLSKQELDRLVTKVNNLYHLNPEAEITLEANPDDLSLQKLKELKASGINRLSIGVQSFIDRDLRWMNRAHNAQEAMGCLSDARKAGFDNFSADLIFGTPHLTDEEWMDNIQKMVSFAPTHISCYALTLEAKTPLAHAIKTHQSPPLDEEQAARQFELLMEELPKAGYEQYEISNFAQPGKRARHNSSYWKGVPYLGIGPAAHSFKPYERQWNVSNNGIYIRSIDKGEIPFKKEVLTPVMQLDEYLMTALRTLEGCDLQYIESHFGEKKCEKVEVAFQPFVRSGQVIQKQHQYTLTTKGKLFADYITAELFQ